MNNLAPLGPGPPGLFEQLSRAPELGTIGWVIQGYPDERIAHDLVPQAVRCWGDARSRGKIVGQPVLYLQSDPRGAHWVGWGRLTEPEERWRALGVTVRCEEVARPGIPLLAPPAVRAAHSALPEELAAHEWEFRELGRALGLGTHRDRTPYLDTDARDLRLSAHDLRFLLRLQPRLADFGRRVPPSIA